MAIPISFDRDKAAEMLSALADGGSIKHEGPWTFHDVLALAGASYFCAMSHGPQVSGRPQVSEHEEHREAVEKAFFAELFGAIEFVGQLTMRVHHGEFDDDFEAHVEAVLLRDGDGSERRFVVYPIKGFRMTDGDSETE